MNTLRIENEYEAENDISRRQYDADSRSFLTYMASVRLWMNDVDFYIFVLERKGEAI